MSEAVIASIITGVLALIGVIWTNRKSTADLFAKLDKQSELSDAKLDKEIAVVKTEIENLSTYGALAAGTSLLPEISITPPKKCIATNTVDCMRSGAVFGTAAMIDGLIDRMEEELGMKCTVVATGGLASSIVPCCRHEIVCDDDLLLKGLWVLWEKNRK